MSPELILFIAQFISKRIEDYRNRNIILTEEQIAQMFESDYNEAIKTNDRLLKITE